MDLDEDFDDMLTSFEQEIMEEDIKSDQKASFSSPVLPPSKCPQTLKTKTALKVKPISDLSQSSAEPQDLVSPKMVRIWNELPSKEPAHPTPQLILCCYACNMEMPDEEALADHLVDHVKKGENSEPVHLSLMEDTEICHLCCMVFNGLAEVISHYRSYHEDKPIACDGCGCSFQDHAFLIRHFKACPKFHYSRRSRLTPVVPPPSSAAPPPPPPPKTSKAPRNAPANSQRTEKVLKCFQCDFSCSDQNTLSDHWFSHGIESTHRPWVNRVETVEGIACGLCRRSFSTKKRRKHHWINHHRTQTLYPKLKLSPDGINVNCGLCLRDFDCSEDKYDHWDSEHRIPNKTGCLFFCGLCDSLFKTETELRIHNIDFHNAEGGQLPSNTSRQQDLEDEVDRDTPAVRTFNALVCDLCEAALSDVELAQNHFLLQHGLSVKDLRDIRTGKWHSPQRVFAGLEKNRNHQLFMMEMQELTLKMFSNECYQKDLHCFQCRQSMSTIPDLKAHLSRAHLKTQNEIFTMELENKFDDFVVKFKCPMCSVSLFNRHDRLRHLINCHGLPILDVLNFKKTRLSVTAQGCLAMDNVLLNPKNG
ncbi:uncharacterized protein LOC131891972 [Tigriopus californicus]|nr:uncharacterized protein LOC131891972 [Tigriopus californicus]